MYKLEFTLKQHTPIIHFQHDQHGATLRATELKPKLDKFLISNFSALKDYLIKGQEKALNYKIKIISEEVSEPFPFDIPEGYPLFFGNMNVHGRERKHLVYVEKIKIEFKSFFKDINEAIENSFQDFLLNNNFGTRQSKGFGSFTIENERYEDNFDFSFQLEINNKNDFLLLRSLPRDFENESIKNFTRLFSQIDIFYKSLRSGINRKGRGNITQFYIKSAIFYYAKDRLGKQWDKKSIKDFYLPKELKEQQTEHGSPDILSFSSTDSTNLLLKDLFGLSSNESWLSYNSNIEKSNGNIDRFQSPLFIKPVRINENKFFIGTKVKDFKSLIFDESFDIAFGGRSGLTLKTPTSFDWDDFIDYLKTDLPDLKSRCSSKNELFNQPEYHILNNIYNQIN